MGASRRSRKVLDVALELADRDFESLGDLGGPDRALLAEESVDAGDALELAHGTTFCTSGLLLGDIVRPVSAPARGAIHSDSSQSLSHSAA